MVSPVRGDYRRLQAETPLIDLFKFAEPALSAGVDVQNIPIYPVVEYAVNRTTHREPFGLPRLTNRDEENGDGVEMA
jgi:hypothetical protein